MRDKVFTWSEPGPEKSLLPSSPGGGALVVGTSQSSVGGVTQRLLFLSNTSMAGHLWSRGYPPWHAQYLLQDLPSGTLPLASSLHSAERKMIVSKHTDHQPENPLTMFLAAGHVLGPVTGVGLLVVEEASDAELLSGCPIPAGPVAGA